MPDTLVGIDELRLYLGCEQDRDDHRPVAERLRASIETGSRTFHVHANKVRWCRTGADGAFVSRDALPAGTWELAFNSRSIELVEPKQVTIPEQGPMQPLTIVVRQPPYIGGVVVDDTGAPVKGVGLQAVLEGSGRMASARTRDDGTFRIYRVENCPDEVAIQVDDPGPCERAELPDRHAWGMHDIRIELRRALTVELSVVVAGNR